MRNISLILLVASIALIQIASADWNCPKDWKKTSFGCQTIGTYERSGYPLSGSKNPNAVRRECEKVNPQLGCTLYGSSYFPNCKAGFTNKNCCTCEFSSYDKINGFKKYGSEPESKLGNYMIQPK